MAEVFDPTDVPSVTAGEMAAVLEAVVEAERARVFFYGVGTGDRAAVEAAFWSRFQGAPSRGGAALLRLWSLVEVLSARRLRQRVMLEGYPFLEEAVASAADQRLNVDWGFNPQRLLWAIAERQERSRPQRPSRVVRRPVSGREATGSGTRQRRTASAIADYARY